MKIYLKIEKDTFLAMAGIVARIYTECSYRWMDTGYVPKYYWPIAIHYYKITASVYEKWNEKRIGQLYSYTIYIDLALALLEYLQNIEQVTHDEQKLLSILHQALASRNFSSESLNMKTLQA